MNSSDAIYGAVPRRLQMPLCDRIISSEVSNDYVLPDYQPEIRRVLRVSATSLPPAKYIGGGKAEFNGTVDYQLLYIGSDGELYSAHFSAEYDFSAPLEITSDFDLGEGVLLLADTKEENISVRVSAPRKLNIKCRLGSRVRAYGMMIAEERITGEEVQPECIQRLENMASASVMLSGTGETSELSDEIAFSGEDTRIISASAEAIIKETVASEGYADCRGEIALRLLVCRDGASASAEVLSRNIPFDQRVEIDDLTPNGVCRGKIYISDVSVSVDEGRIISVLNIIPEVSACCDTSFVYTKDMYSTGNYCESAYKDYAVPSVTVVPSSNFSQNKRIALSELGISDGSRVIDVFCKPTAEKIESVKNKYTVSGQCKYALLLENEGEYNICELTLPIKYEFSGDYGTPESFSADMQTLSCRARIDGDNLGIDAELSVCAELCEVKRINALSEVRFGERLKRGEGDVVICFPAPDDTVWTVAKRYFVPTSKISSPSGAVESLDGLNYVLVNY